MASRDTRFKPGQSGNPAGRPKGARSKLTEAFLEDVYALWQEIGPRALMSMAMFDTSNFVKVVASLQTKNVNLSGELNHQHNHVGLSETEDWLVELCQTSQAGKQPAKPH